MKILILDDEISDLISFMLRRRGLITYPVSSIAEGEEVLKSSNMDVVLIDVRLHKESGIDFIKIAKKYGCKVIMTTAYVDAEEKAKEAGADGYIRKPFSHEDILHAIKEI